MHASSPSWALLASFAFYSGCTKPHYQDCDSSSECSLLSGGTCTANPASGNQWCAYPDPACPGGYRWSELAGDGLAEDCVLGSYDAASTCVGTECPDARPTCSDPDILAFLSMRNVSAGDIYTTGPSGDPELNATNQSAADRAIAELKLAWSPTEDRLAYSKTAPSGQGYSQIWVVNTDGTREYAVTSGHFDVEPTWSHDGLDVAFARSDTPLDAQHVWVTPAGGGTAFQVTHGEKDLHPAWSPDGQRIAYFSQRGAYTDLYTIRPDGTGDTPITTNGLGAGARSAAEWSPDGERLLFVSSGSGNTDVWIINSDGTNPQRLTTTSAEETTAIWTPDGTTVVYSVLTTRSDEDLRAVRSDGTNDVPYAVGPDNDRLPTVSPDGHFLAWESDRDGDQEIYVAAADASGPVRLTTAAGTDTLPAWRSCR